MANLLSRIAFALTAVPTLGETFVANGRLQDQRGGGDCGYSATVALHRPLARWPGGVAIIRGGVVIDLNTGEFAARTSIHDP